MLETVPGQRGVVGLDIEFEILLQPVLTQETHHRGAVEIVLVLHRLHRLGLDQEIALEADAASVVARQGEEARQVLLLAPHLRVVQARIPLATAPEHVVLPAQRHRRLQRRLDLHRRARHHVEIRVGRRAIHVARMREQIGRAPQQLDAGVGLTLLGDADHVLQIRLVLADGLRVRGQIHVVEAVIRNTEFGEKLERRIGLGLGPRQRVAAGVPRIGARARAERIGAVTAETMPIRHRKTQVRGHGLAANLLVGVVHLERQRVVRGLAFERNAADARKIFLGADVDGVAHEKRIPIEWENDGRHGVIGVQTVAMSIGAGACVAGARNAAVASRRCSGGRHWVWTTRSVRAAR